MSDNPASIKIGAASASTSSRPPSKSHYNSSRVGGSSTSAYVGTSDLGRGAIAAAAKDNEREKTAEKEKVVVEKVGGARVVIGGAAQGVVAAGNVRRTTLNAIGVNSLQKENPILRHIKNVAWEFSDIEADYQVGATTGLLYLSYHLLKPEYIHGRIAKMGQMYSLRIMLVQCDVENHAAAIRELTKVCIVYNYTMMVAWSSQEAGRYLEMYKSFERKAPDLIKERVEDGHLAHLTAALTSVRGVNRTDVTTLATDFGSFKNIILASSDALVNCVGVGEKKSKRLRDAFTSGFTVRSNNKKRKSQAEKNGGMGPALN